MRIHITCGPEEMAARLVAEKIISLAERSNCFGRVPSLSNSLNQGKLSKNSIFTQADARQMVAHMPVTETVIPNTAATALCGLCWSLSMVPALSKAEQTFWRYIDAS